MPLAVFRLDRSPIDPSPHSTLPLAAQRAYAARLCMQPKPVAASAPPEPPKRPLRVGLISLGCAKNLVDAEIMLGSLMQGGLEITNDATAADALIVNTCSFIDAAQEESVDTILESAEVRQARRPHQALIVSGCLPQRFREDLPKLL